MYVLINVKTLLLFSSFKNYIYFNSIHLLRTENHYRRHHVRETVKVATVSNNIRNNDTDAVRPEKKYGTATDV